MKRVISGATIGALLIAMQATGVLATFYKGITSNFQGASNYVFDTNYGYGNGYDDTTLTYGYGYGYGATYVAPSTSHGGSSHFSTNTNTNNTSTESTSTDTNTDNSNTDSTDTNTSTDTNMSEVEKAVTNSILGNKITIKDGVATLNGCNFPLKKHTFLDDDKTFATKYVALLQRLGIIHGRDGNGKLFVPESNTTRFEFIKMTERVFCLDYSNVDDSNLPFSDVTKGTWQGRVAQEALNAKLVTSKNNKFRGNDNISRIEAFKVLTLAAKMEVPATKSTVFTDVNIDWMKKYAEAVRKAGIANGQTVNGKLILEPLRNIKRSESAKTIVKAVWAK